MSRELDTTRSPFARLRDVLRPLAVLLSVALWISGCAGSSPNVVEEPPLRVLPISSIVLPVDTDDDQLSWKPVVQAYLAGRPIYDSVFRQPSGPFSTIDVSCNRARSIGVYIQVDSKMQEPRTEARRPLRFSWSHKGIDGDKPVVNRFRPAVLILEVQGVLMYSDFLELTKARRVDGEWLLTVHYLGEEIYREEFELSDCEVPYAPDWYEGDDT